MIPIEKNQGYIKSIRGSMIDVVFGGELPFINNKLTSGEDGRVVLEVSSHVDDQTVRAIALTSTPYRPAPTGKK